MWEGKGWEVKQNKEETNKVEEKWNREKLNKRRKKTKTKMWIPNLEQEANGKETLKIYNKKEM